MDRLEKVVSILFNKTENEVGEMTVSEFTNYSKQCAFLMGTEKIPGKAVKYIRVGKHKYYIEHNPAKLIEKMKHRQYVESMHFSENLISKIHFMMASIVQPVKFGLRIKNTAARHGDIANVLLNARFIDVYHTAVFFCKLYAASITVIKDYLTEEMRMKINPAEAQMIQEALQSVTDGFTLLSK